MVVMAVVEVVVVVVVVVVGLCASAPKTAIGFVLFFARICTMVGCCPTVPHSWFHRAGRSKRDCQVISYYVEYGTHR